MRELPLGREKAMHNKAPEKMFLPKRCSRFECRSITRWRFVIQVPELRGQVQIRVCQYCQVHYWVGTRIIELNGQLRVEVIFIQKGKGQ